MVEWHVFSGEMQPGVNERPNPALPPQPKPSHRPCEAHQKQAPEVWSPLYDV